MWSIHTIEYYSAIKRKEALTHATTLMNVRNMMLSERSHKRLHIVGFHVYEISRIGISVETDSRLVAFRGKRDGGMESDPYWVRGFCLR